MVRYLTETYLAGVEQYDLKMTIDKTLAICVKKIKKINEPFVLNEDGHLIKILDNNYCILEFIPFNRNYVLRVHLDDDGNLIERFFTVVDNLQIQNGIPCYEDLKLSFVCSPFGNKVYNQERFNQIIQENKFSENKHFELLEDFKKLKQEISQGNNDLYNLNYKKHLF